MVIKLCVTYIKMRAPIAKDA